MTLSKPTVGQPGWNAQVDATIDEVNAHETRIATLEAGGGGGGAVTSVNGQTGAVSLGLANLTDTTVTGAAVGDLLAVTAVSGGNATAFARTSRPALLARAAVLSSYIGV